MIGNPRLSTPYILTILVIVTIAVIVRMYPRFADDTLLVFVAVLLVSAMTGGAVLAWINWIWAHINDRLLETRRAQSVTPITEAADHVSRLTKEQLDFLKMSGYYETIGLFDTDTGLQRALMTQHGGIPWGIVERELRASTMIGLRAIREYSDGSADREWRRLFTEHCINRGYAMKADGPYAARWIDSKMRGILAAKWGIKLYGPSEEAQDE